MTISFNKVNSSSYEKLIINLILAVILIAIVLPGLIFSTELPEGLTLSKDLCFQFLIGISLSLTLTYLLIANKLTFEFHSIDLLVILFLVYPIVQELFGEEKFLFTIAKGNGLGLIILYVALRVILKPFIVQSQIENVIYFTLCCHVFLGLLQIIGVLSSNHPDFISTGAFFNPALFSFMLVILLSFMITFYWRNFNRRNFNLKSILKLLPQFFALGLIVISFSRTSWIALVIIFLMQLYKKTLPRLSWPNLIILPLIILCTGFTVFLLYKMKEDSAIGRILMWKVSWSMVKDNLWFGVGNGNFSVNYLKYQRILFHELPADFIKYRDIANDIRFAFNDVLQIFAEGGVIYGLMFLVIIGFIGGKILKYALSSKPNKNILLGFFCMILMLLICGIFSYPLTQMPFRIILVALIALSLNFLDIEERVIKNAPIIRYPLIFICLSLVFILTIKSYEYFNALKKWSYAVNFSAQSKLKFIESLEPLLNTNGYYLYYLGTCYFDCRDYKNAVKLLLRSKKTYPSADLYIELGKCYEAMGDLQFATKEYNYIKEAIPRNLEPYYYLANLYLKTQNIGEFHQVLSQLKALNVSKRTNYVQERKEEILALMESAK